MLLMLFFQEITFPFRRKYARIAKQLLIRSSYTIIIKAKACPNII
jgi:hypothetical protein